MFEWPSNIHLAIPGFVTFGDEIRSNVSVLAERLQGSSVKTAVIPSKTQWLYSIQTTQVSLIHVWKTQIYQKIQRRDTWKLVWETKRRSPDISDKKYLSALEKLTWLHHQKWQIQILQSGYWKVTQTLHYLILSDKK